MPDDKPWRICFPRPIVLHGTDRRSILEAALEYCRLPDKLLIEPLHAPEKKDPGP